jgi:hypothetical protein
MKDHSEDLGLDGRIISGWTLEKRGLQGVDWMHLVQNRYQWWALVNMVPYLRVP